MNETPRTPPPLAQWLFQHCLHDADADAVLGDLEETYRYLCTRDGAAYARRWYWSQVLRSAPVFLFRTLYWNVAMWKNYLTIALRTLKRHKGYTFINVTGLAVGVACCLLILLYVRDELRYDRHHENADHIYRVIREVRGNDGEWRGRASTPYLLLPLLREDVPQIRQAVRLADSSYLVRHGDTQFTEDDFFFADSTVFDVFTLPFVSGDPETALDEPFTVVLTATTARKYFGGADPIGKTLTIDNTRKFTVTGVVEDAPPTSHFHFDFLASLASTRSWFGRNMFEHWGSVWTYTYLLLHEDASVEELQAQLDALLARHLPPDIPFEVRVRIQPLTDIHLHSHLTAEIEPNGDVTYLYLFSIVAVFILFIACINFMNLATARAANRAREVGVRKMLGAYRGQLIRQFLSESLLLSLFAVVLAAGLAAMGLPLLNAVSGKTLALDVFGNPVVVLGLPGMGLLVGVFSGSYPAFFLSRFQPVRVLKGTLGGHTARGTVWLRKGLVTLQFAISIALIAGTFVVYQQLRFVQEKNLGFDREQTVEVYLKDRDLRARYAVLKEAFRQAPGVVHVAAASNAPPDDLNSWRVRPEHTPADQEDLMSVMAVDYEYVETLGLELAAGRAFSEDFPSDAGEAILINEAAAEQWGLDAPVGQRFYLQTTNRTCTVIGVVEDFHLASLHQEIEPVFLIIWPNWYNRLLIKMRPERVAETIAYLERQWQAHAADWPFEYAFLDARFDALHRAEQRLGRLFTTFAGLAVLIACLGLFGLAAFTAEQRTKEIGVRKVLGATVPSIVGLLSRQFAALVLAALVVATPVAYLAMNRWLDDFAYRVDLSVGVFLLAGALALAVALVTVGYQAVKAALTDPVKALRYE